MKNLETYFNTIAEKSIAEFKDRGSKFIAHAYPIENVEDVKIYLSDLKKEHIKAVHFCYAYRVGTQGLIFRSNDNGEPSNSAGKPILGQIDSKELTNVLVVVVRYFGGTLLGVPGLINAYKTATSLVLQTTPIIQKLITQKIEAQFNYTQLNTVLTIANQYQAVVIKQEQLLFCVFTFEIPINRIKDFKYSLEQIPVDSVMIHKK